MEDGNYSSDAGQEAFTGIGCCNGRALRSPPSTGAQKMEDNMQRTLIEMSPKPIVLIAKQLIEPFCKYNEKVPCAQNIMQTIFRHRATRLRRILISILKMQFIAYFGLYCPV